MMSEKSKIIDECVYTMAQLTEDEKIRMQCEARKDNLAIEIGIRKRATQEGLKEGLEKGLKQGLKEGLEKGLKQGLEEGHRAGLKEGRREGLKEGELHKAREIAIELLDVLDKPTISKKTGLSLDEIEALEKEHS